LKLRVRGFRHSCRCSHSVTRWRLW
jgi:hypothetical protein